jgi:hypothetical protein
MKIIKALLGLFLIFIFHLPKLIFISLQVSYDLVFNKQENLTADPKKHLKRASELLLKKKNSLLLYAALEIRFASERIIDNQIALADKVSNKTLKKYDPVIKKKAMTLIDPNSDKSQKIFFINKDTGQKIEWGTYRPIELERIKEIKNRLGDLLHPKVGLNLGISDDPWYIETRRFLEESVKYLKDNLKDNESYFAYSNLDNFELEVIN